MDGGSRARPRVLMQEFCGPLVVVGPRCDVGADEAPAGTYVVALDGSIGDEGVIPVVAAWTMEFGGTPWLVDVVERWARRAPDVVESAYVNHRAGRLRRRIGRDVEHETLHGDHPARAIVEFAGDAAASLIFVGTDADNACGARRRDRWRPRSSGTRRAPSCCCACRRSSRRRGRPPGRWPRRFRRCGRGRGASSTDRMRSGFAEREPVRLPRLVVEAHQAHLLDRRGRGAKRVDGDRRRLVDRVAVDPRRDRGEGDRADAELVGRAPATRGSTTRAARARRNRRRATPGRPCGSPSAAGSRNPGVAFA